MAVLEELIGREIPEDHSRLLEVFGNQITKKKRRLALSNGFSAEEIRACEEQYFFPFGARRDFFERYRDSGIDRTVFNKECRRFSVNATSLGTALIKSGFVMTVEGQFISQDQLIKHNYFQDEWINQLYDLLCLYDHNDFLELYTQIEKDPQCGPMKMFIDFKERAIFELIAWINNLTVKDKSDKTIKPTKQLYEILFDLCESNFPEIMTLDAAYYDQVIGLYKKANLGVLSDEELELIDFFERYHGRPSFYNYAIRNVPEFEEHFKDCIGEVNIECLKIIDNYQLFAQELRESIIIDDIELRLKLSEAKKIKPEKLGRFILTEEKLRSNKIREIIPSPLLPFLYKLAGSEDYYVSESAISSNRALFILQYFEEAINKRVADYNLEMEVNDKEKKLTGFLFEDCIESLLRVVSDTTKYHFDVIEHSIKAPDPKLMEVLFLDQALTEIDLLAINHEQEYAIIVECHNYLSYDNTWKTINDTLKIAYTADYISDKLQVEDYRFKIKHRKVFIPQGYQVVPVILCNHVQSRVNRELRSVIRDMMPVMIYTGMMGHLGFMDFIEKYLEGPEAYLDWLKDKESKTVFH